MTPELHEYIRAHRAAGSSDEAIQAELIKAGWNPHDVATALGNHLPPVPGAPTENVAATGLPSFGDLLSSAWSTYKNNSRVLVGISALPIAAFAVLGFLGGASAAIISRTGLANNALTIVLGVVLVVAVFLFVLYLSFWSQVSLLIAIRDADQKPGLKHSYTQASHLVWGFIGTALLGALVTMGGFILFAIPGIIFAFWYFFATYVKVDEGVGGLGALVRSRHYAKGNVWGMLWRSMVLGLIIWVPYFLLAIAIGIINHFAKLHPFIAQIPLFVYQVLVAPLVTCFAYSLFRGARATKAGQPAPAYSHGWLTFWAIFGGILVPLMILSSVVLLALNSARGKARDAKRVADLRQMTSAIMLYENDNGTYPVSLKELEGKYIVEVPKAPIPAEEGCTNSNNTYHYETVAASADSDELAGFEISTCLGSKTGGYGPGVIIATEEGIYPTKPQNGTKSPANYR